MDKSKALIALNENNYSYPLADVSGLSEEEKKDLFRRGLHMPKDLHSDEEFEKWLTLYVEWNTYSDGGERELSEEEKARCRMDTAVYQRGLWYHRKRFNAWKKEHLQPLINELADRAVHDPQYDWQYLYALEYAKLRCMRAYFSHSLIADRNGNFGFNRWIDTCINLLQHLKEDGMYLTEKQIERMNIRNVGDLVSSTLMDEYQKAPRRKEDEESVVPDWSYYGRKIYIRKMERLYYRIRLYKMREWWE